MSSIFISTKHPVILALVNSLAPWVRSALPARGPSGIGSSITGRNQEDAGASSKGIWSVVKAYSRALSVTYV